MKNRRLKYDSDFYRVTKAGYICLDGIKYIEKPKYYLVHRDDIKKISIKNIYGNNNKFKTKNLEYILNLKAFKNNLRSYPNEKQIKELYRCLWYINRGVIFKYESLAKLISNNIETKLVERVQYGLNIKKGNGLLSCIIRHGISEGIRVSHKVNKLFKKGENNPGYNHGGKLSPYSKRFLKYTDMNEEEIEETRKKSLKKAEDNRSYNTRIEYYLNKGYSEEEAKIALSERQRTFSIDKCIEKYGEEDGLKIWKQRQEKWRSSLAKIPENIKKEIRLKQAASKSCMFNNWNEFKNKPSIIYYIHFFNEELSFYKIGITSKSIKERFGTRVKFKALYNLDYEVIDVKELNMREAFSLEQKILSYNKDKRIIVDYNKFKTTEAFYEDVLEGVINEAI